MSTRGRPLRFLGLVLGGWIGFRAVMLWPVAAVSPAFPTTARPLAVIRAEPVPRHLVTMTGAATIETPFRLVDRETHASLKPRTIAAVAFVPDAAMPGLMMGAHAHNIAAVRLALQGLMRFGTPMAPPSVDIAPFTSPGAGTAQYSRRANGSRWRASLWLFARSGDTAPTGFSGGTIGGSQAGARVGYLVDRAERLMIYGRVSTALSQPQAEAALGVDWQPTALPIHLLAEQRLPLSQGRGGPTLGAVTGIGPVMVARSFRLEAYGQAGVVLRHGGVGFADGAVRLDHGVAEAGKLRLSLGGGVWGAAQPDAQRLDLGPSVAVDVPVNARPVRLSLDWRERVAGAARPASGPALTIGTNF